MKKLIILLSMSAFLAGCGGWDNQYTKMKANAITGDFRVTMYSGGQVVKVWEIKSGYVSAERDSDGWFFNYNGKLIRVSGDVVIEQL